MSRYSSFSSGKVWLDTSGRPIQAHGFSVFYSEKDGKYYWYGENKEKTKGGIFNKVWHWGVRCTCADRWMPGKMAMKMSTQVLTGMEKHFKDYKPDTSPREASPLPGKKLKHPEKTCKSTYVWLPVEWQGEKPIIKWYDEWRVEDYK